jgi:hypothetical protein
MQPSHDRSRCNAHHGIGTERRVCHELTPPYARTAFVSKSCRPPARRRHNLLRHEPPSRASILAKSRSQTSTPASTSRVREASERLKRATLGTALARRNADALWPARLWTNPVRRGTRACVAVATTSEAGAVDRHAVLHGFVLSVADINTSDGSAGGSPQSVTIADIVLYNDAGGVCCGASLRLAPPVPSKPPSSAKRRCKPSSTPCRWRAKNQVSFQLRGKPRRLKR